MVNFFNEKMVMNGIENKDIFKAKLKKKKRCFNSRKSSIWKYYPENFSNHRKELSGNLM